MEIKKADSKGRVTGFKPDAIYHIEQRGVNYSVREVIFEIDLSEGTEPLNPEGIEYLSQFDLDHDLILRDECTEEGYWELQKDTSGKWEVEHGVRKRVRKPWPKNFDYSQFAIKALDIK